MRQKLELSLTCQKLRTLLMRDPIERFGDRADNYAKFRPGYPDPMLGFLLDVVSLPAVVADIGSGTGILTRQLLDQAGARPYQRNMFIGKDFGVSRRLARCELNTGWKPMLCYIAKTSSTRSTSASVL